MGNGQHRNRRGARPRPSPHKHGVAGNAGRAEMRLIPPIPPIAPVIVADGGAAAEPVTDKDDGEQPLEPAPAPAPAPPAMPGALAAELSLETAPPAAPEKTSQQQPSGGNGHAPQPARTATAPPEEGGAHTGAERTSTPESDAPRSGRGRFDRFYTPGQGARGDRAERAERVAPPINPVLPPVISASPTPPRRAERAERAERIERGLSASNPVDEDDSPDYTGPRGDVRGAVGTLIDTLHELFTRDRAVASQGGAARCGVCYLHFPVGELLYRDAEGFYVCESCAHALGSARVSMVRRQQRQ